MQLLLPESRTVMPPDNQNEIQQEWPDPPERKLVQAIRKIVAEDMYQGIPLSHVLGSDITIAWWHGVFTARRFARISAFIEMGYYLWGREVYKAVRGQGRHLPKHLPTGRIAVEVLSAQPKLRSFWEPVAERLGPAKCILVLGRRGLRSEVSPRFVSVALDEVPIDWSHCRLWVLQRLRRWEREMSHLSIRFGLAASATQQLISLLIVQVMRLAESQMLGKIIRPRVFLSTADQGSLGGPLSAALSAQGVSTYTLVHGAIGRQSMSELVPLNAEFVFVWGDIQRNLFSRAGVGDHRIIMVGCQRSRQSTLPSREVCRTLLEEIGLKGEGPFVVVAFTVLNSSDRLVWTCAVRELMDALPEARFLCRLHPSNRLTDFAGLLPESPRMRVLESDVLSLEETIAFADAVIVDSSTFGFDALLHGRLVAVLDPYSTPKHQDVMLEVVEAEAALYSRNAIDLAKKLRRTWSDTAECRLLQEKADHFVARYICAYGDEAVQRIVVHLHAN